VYVHVKYSLFRKMNYFEYHNMIINTMESITCINILPRTHYKEIQPKFVAESTYYQNVMCYMGAKLGISL